MSKIMLVEDDNNLREIYEARLLAEGYEIVSAKDGEEALAMAVKEKPDLIISDVMMPKISGFDMLDILRTTPETKNTKIIMMTALSQAEDKARADKLGADRYLVKSQVTLEDVAAVAREVLNGDASATNAETTPTVAPVSAPEPIVVTPVIPAAEEPSAATPQPLDPQPTEPTVTAPTPVTPVPEPVQTTTPPVIEPDTTPVDNPGAVDSNLSQTTEDEENAIDSQINNFIEHATSTEPEEKPAPIPTPAPVAQTQPQDEIEHIAVTQAPPDATAAAADNAARLADAVNDLLQKPEDAAPSAPEVATPPTATTPEASKPTSTPVESPSNGKKIIQPLNDMASSTPDLNALLQKEELSEAGVTNVNTQPTTSGDNLVITPDGEMKPVSPSPDAVSAAPASPAPESTIQPEQPAPAAPQAPTDPNDPNNIAL